MRRPDRPAPRVPAAPSRLALAAALAWPGLAAAVEATPAPLAARVDEPAACVEAGFAPGADPAAPGALAARIGWRADGRPCRQVALHPLDPAALPAVLAALRAFHARGVPACPAGPPNGLRALRVEPDGRVQLEAEACGRIARLRVDPARPGPEARAEEAAQAAWSVDRRSRRHAATAAAQEAAEDAPATASAGWGALLPDATRLDVSYRRETSEDRRKRETDLRAHAAWYRGDDEVQLELVAQVERYDDRAPKDERNARGVWFHAVTPGFFTMLEGFSERDEVRVLGITLDYRLVQGGAGLGWRWGEHPRGWVRAAALYNRFDLTLFGVDAEVGLDAPSLYLAGEWAAGERLHLRGDARHYWWPGGGDTGLEAGGEVVYDLGRALGIGLRWEYSRNAATLSRADEESTSLFLRYRP